MHACRRIVGKLIFSASRKKAAQNRQKQQQNVLIAFHHHDIFLEIQYTANIVQFFSHLFLLL